MQHGYIVFSPITHSVPISWFQEREKNNYDFWLTQDFPFVEWCDTLMIATYPGWDSSYGVSEETVYAKALKKMICYIDPKTKEIY
jgi:hypothetical protein